MKPPRRKMIKSAKEPPVLAMTIFLPKAAISRKSASAMLCTRNMRNQYVKNLQGFKRLYFDRCAVNNV